MLKSWEGNQKYLWRSYKDFGMYNMWAKYFYKSTRSSQSCNFGKILQCWKNLGMFNILMMVIPSSRFLIWICLRQKVRQWLPPCVLQGGSHCLTFWQRNIRSKNLYDGTYNIFFCLKDWLFGGCQKLPCTETRIAQPSKQVHMSSMWHMKVNGQGYLFL